MADDQDIKEMLHQMNSLIRVMAKKNNVDVEGILPTPMPVAPPTMKPYQKEGYQRLQEIHDKAQEKIGNYHPYIGDFVPYPSSYYVSKIEKPRQLYPVPLTYANAKIQEWAKSFEGYSSAEDFYIDIAKSSFRQHHKWEVTQPELEQMIQLITENAERTKDGDCSMAWGASRQEKPHLYHENLNEIYVRILDKAASIVREHTLQEEFIKYSLGEPLPPEDEDEEAELRELAKYSRADNEYNNFIFAELLKKDITSADQIKLEDLEPYGFDISGEYNKYTGTAMVEDLLHWLPFSQYSSSPLAEVTIISEESI